MKKIILILLISASLAACKTDTKTDLQTNKVMLTDTSGIYNNSGSSDTGTALQKGERPSKIKYHESERTENEKISRSPERSTTSTTTTTENTTTTRKKGWSNRAKDAVIGGAAGAVGGAIISKHKGTGAIVGGLAGAAGGYIIGNEKDKKNDR